MRFPLHWPPPRLLASLLVSGILLCSAHHFHWFSSIDFAMYDIGVSLRSSPEKGADVVVIAIDKRTLEESFSNPPFPVSKHLRQHSRLIDRLTAAGAAIIVFDILFDRTEDESQSAVELFVEAISASGRVVLCTAVEQEITSEEAVAQGLTIARLVGPPQFISDAALGVGLVNMPIDPDGSIRRFALKTAFLGDTISSLALEVAQRYSARQSRALQAPKDTVFIDYAWSGSAIAKIPYATILNGENWQSEVKDRITIIGVTENESIDSYRTPVTITSNHRQKKMSGVEIQALALQTLLAGSVISQIDLSETAGVGFLVYLGLFGLLLKLRPLSGLSVLLAAMIAIPVGSALSTTMLALVIPPGAPLLSLLGGGTTMFVLNLSASHRVRQLQEKIISETEADYQSGRIIQQNLQPVSFPESEKYEISAMQIPCKGVGGDYYDVIKLSDSRIGLLIADVAGKGVGGSLIMSNLQGFFRHIGREIESPGGVLGELNGLVSRAAGSHHQFVTLFYGIYDSHMRSITYANAAHCYPILCSEDGTIKMLSNGGLMLGPFADTVWDNFECPLQSGDVLCLFTDGVSEAESHCTEEQYGEDRIIESVLENRHKSPKSVHESILESCVNYSGSSTFDDDWTVVVFKTKG